MITYVTSSPFREDVDRPTFSNTNGFIDRIRQDLPEEFLQKLQMGCILKLPICRGHFYGFCQCGHPF